MSAATAALARRIKARGRELGLAAVGVAPMVPSLRAGALREWLDAGRAGAMAYMRRTGEERADPGRRFPWAQSAVVAAAAYLPYKEDRHTQAGLLPHVARYAVGRDYHRVLGERLEALARFIEAESPGARTRACADTGPILERELAARAGLGWFGKSTNLIAPGGDSWILLGQILTDLDLPPDDPVADRCGTCTACIDACPTAAIAAPYVVDATRCISYLTIELRDAIPADKRADLGDWVFGCDVCQEVCPWNRKTASVDDEDFLPGQHLESRSLADLVRLDPEEYRRDFKPTALERPRHRGLVRNALIVAANVRDEEALAGAPARLEDEDPIVRGAAAWALGSAAGPRGRAALERARGRETDAGARGEIDAALDGPTE